MLRPACEVILFGNEQGTAEIAAELGVRHVADVERNDYGTPLVSSMFQTAQEIAAHKLMCYANADIILMSDFLEMVRRIEIDKFLLVGQRWDTDLEETLAFDDPQWEMKLTARVKSLGRLHGMSGIDYFVFPRGLYRSMPPVAVGRPAWDNWMIYRARSLRVPVIDMTGAATVVHQNHGHADYPGGEKAFWEGAEAVRNTMLIGGKDRAFGLNYATSVLTPQGVKPLLSPKYLYYRLRAVPVLHPRLRFLLTLFKALEKLYAGAKGIISKRC